MGDRDRMARRVVLSGAGVVSAAGLGLERLWRSLSEAPPKPTAYVSPPPTEHLGFPLYEVPSYALADAGVPASAQRWLNEGLLAEARDVHHLVASTALALADAGLGLDLESLDPPAAIVAANESPGFEELCSTLFTIGRDGPLTPDPAQRYAALSPRIFALNTFLLPHYLARVFRFSGLSLFVNSACTSGLNALDVAAHEVRAGRSDVAVVAAADNPRSVAKFLWFHQQGLYSPDGALRPFDRDQVGTVFGDGGAALVLEERDSALRRGARIYAEYMGGGFAQDGWKVAVPSPVHARGADAIRFALRDSGVAPEEVDLVVPHGTGTPASDQYEARMLHAVFDRRMPEITALKPYVGHNLGGSALLDLAVLLAAFEHERVPPTPGWREPYDRCPIEPLTRWQERPIGLALKVTCGFAGHYGAAVFRRHDPEETPA